MFSGVAQALVTRVGVRGVLPVGMALSTVALVLFAQLPVHGPYFGDLFPAFLIGGLGLALAFIPMTIGALAGVRPAEAGIASGLINTSQQIGGAIGVASRRRSRRPSRPTTSTPTRRGPAQPAALMHGFQTAFYVLAGIAAVGGILAAMLLEPKTAQPTETIALADHGAPEVQPAA